MNGMPNVDPAVMQQLMSNPEIMQLMSDPSVMPALTQLMQNPAQAAQLAAGNPKIARLIQLMQSGLGGGSGVPASQIPNAWAGGSQPSGAGGDDLSSGSVIEVYSDDHFRRLLNQAGPKLLVADFYATWCGPCQQIAPQIHDLAKTYAGKAVFVKVDVDKNRALAQQYQVQAMPTFLFFKNSAKTDSVRGADFAKISSMVSSLSYVAPPVAKTSPYKLFPMSDSEMITFKKVKYDVIAEKFGEFQAQNPDVLSESEAARIHEIVDIMRRETEFHSTQFSAAQFAALEKVLRSWPHAHIPPVMNLVRVMTLHPNAAQFLASDQGQSLLEAIVSIIGSSQVAANRLVGLRFLINCFSRRVSARMMAARHEMVLDGVSTCRSQKPSVQLAYISLLLNFSALFTTNPKLYADAKIAVLSALIELLQTCGSDSDAKMCFRGLVCLGTLVFRDQATAELAQALEAEAAVETIRDAHPANDDIKQAASEVVQAMSDTES